MTRHLLSTAALVAFLASGHPLTPTTPLRTQASRSQAAGLSASPAPVRLLTIDGLLVAVGLERRSPELLDVAVQFEPGIAPPDVLLWTGTKNGWGARRSRPEPVAGLAGFLQATVAAPAPTDRLWLGLERAERRPAIAGLRLDPPA